MSVRLTIGQAALDPPSTGLLLKGMLKERGIYSKEAEAVVCYGNPVGTRHKTINGVGTGGKMNTMDLLTEAGVRTVPWFRGSNIPRGFKFPALARKNHGYGGKDIVPVFQPQEVPWRVAAGWDWFSTHIPLETEYRVWIFRGECLDTYEKVMRRPEDFKGVAGRNFGNGFDFEHTRNHQDATEEAVKALKAIKYDFGAVDMLRGTDGRIYILEVNSAPGVIRSKAEATLIKLVDKIQEWDSLGHPSYRV